MADEKQNTTDPWEEAAKNFKPSSSPAAAPTSGNDDWKVWQQGGSAAAPAANEPLSVGGTLAAMGDQARRAGGAALEQLNPMPLVHAVAHPIDTAGQMFHATSDAIGRTRKALGEGQYGEAAKSAVGAIPVFGPQAEQITREATSGQIPEAIGHLGGFALASKVPAGIGRVVESGAAPLAESALGIKAINRAYNRAPGLAALTETTGVRPETIASQARTRLGDINTQLENTVAQSQAPASLIPARGVLSDAEAVARGRNAANTVKQLQPMQGQLSTNMNSGLPLATIQTPEGLLALKRGFGDEFIHNWNPETMHGVRGTAAQTYRALADELHSAVPESAALDERASSLIPVAERAESIDRGPGVGQRSMHRIAAHTGAGLGAGLGYYLGGLPGAMAGAVIPEILADPTTQMIGARSLYGTGRALQAPALGRIAPAVPLLPRDGQQ